MNDKIINLTEKIEKRKSLNNQTKQLDVEDFFNLLLIYKRREHALASFDLKFIERAFGRYKNMERFSSILNNLETEYNENGEEIINFKSAVDKKVEEKTIIFMDGEVIILGKDEYFEDLESKYDEENFLAFDSLYFFIYNDLKYGFDGWQLLFEDEYIKHPKYPEGIITGEFIGQKKDEKVMKQVKKRTIEMLKNKYEQ